MIVFFGPAGAGKSMQGQILAARHGWRWLSTGQLLRDSLDQELHAQMLGGGLVSDEVMNRIIVQALADASSVGGVILDGYPRNLDQAKHLFAAQTEHKQQIELAVVLEVPKTEILQRLEVRGRADDTPEAIDKRLAIYRSEVYPILNYLNEQSVPIVHITGVGTVGQIHDQIERELAGHGVVEAV